MFLRRENRSNGTPLFASLPPNRISQLLDGTGRDSCTLAVILGVTDVEPFIMGITQAAGRVTPLKEAARAVLIAAARNNLIKGIYSYSLAGGKTKIQQRTLGLRAP